MTDQTSAIDEQASFWVVRLSSDQRTRADEEGFRAWLEQDPTHACAYADCSALWEAVGTLTAKDETHEALRHLRSTPTPRRFHRRTIFAGAGVAMAACATGIVGLLVFDSEQSLHTKPGEQRRVRLADGTGVLLNTDTRLRIKFVAAERRVFLDRGQAFFQVAKDKGRPFRVFAGNDEIRAVGTAFEVARIGEKVRVTLEEGRVAIYHNGGATQAIAAPPSPVKSRRAEPDATLMPGQQVELAAAQGLEVRQVDLRRVQAWRYGRIILNDAPLGETVADLNRYGGVQIVLADPALSNLHISGVFHTGRPDDFVESVVAAFPVEVERQDANTIVLQAR